MRSDIDALMRARNLDALLVVGDEVFSAPRHYLTGGASVTGGLVIRPVGGAPVLVVNGMETEEAAASGLRVVSYADVDYQGLAVRYRDDAVGLRVALWGAALAHVGVGGGRVGLYGPGDLERYLPLLGALESGLPGYSFVGDAAPTLFDQAMATKDDDEIAAMRRVAAGTMAAMRAAWDFLASCRVADGQIVDEAGTPVTVGRVKRLVRRTLLDHDLEDTAMIFAPGREGAFPHSRGAADAVLRPHEPIVFDLFPREAGGGYHHDVTRTWCLGSAPAALEALYEHVLTAFDVAVELAKPGVRGADVQTAVLDVFEAQGHPTIRSAPGTQDGYVHSLGHGLGLAIHERPRLSHLSDDVLAVGHAITVEPGLYYPARAMGVRLEDTLVFDSTGALVTLTDFPKDLVIPVRGG